MFNGSEESYVILQDVLLTGISNISFQSTNQEGATKLLANKGINRKIYKPPTTTCSFSKPYNGKDYLQSLTGATNLSGQFVYKNNAIDFTNAAISSYGLNLDSNGFGEINVTLQIFGDMKPTTNLKLLTASADFEALDMTPSIFSLNLDGKNSAIKSLNYEAVFDVKPTSNIGSINYSNVNIFSPVVHKINANIEMLEQEIEDVTGLIQEDKFNKKIDIIFSPKENESSINRIFEIQSIIKDIESSGIALDDLDFSIGTCALNSFQFEKSALTNQTLDSRAGEVVQLSNEYSAYSTIKKVTGSLPTPSEFNTCAEHLSQLEENLNTALFRLNDTFYANQVDFEDREAGQTNFNLWLREIVTREPKTGEDFELKILGTYATNIKAHIDTYYESQTDFENENTGQTDEELLSFIDIYYENEVDFENISTGETNQDLNQF
jgi:hypothetical protein